ncbi:MAG: alpha/beta hydrolase [Spirochaetota bacterium]
MKTEKVFFKNNKAQRIVGKIYRQDDLSPDGVIFCHGLFSTKDGYKITHLAEDIVNAGYTLLAFDFSFVGESEGNISELSVLQELEDLRYAFLFFRDYGIKKIHLVGSSMGGLVSLIFSSILGDRISSQTLIAAPVLLREIMHQMAQKDIDSLPEDGFTVVDGIQINNKFFKEYDKIDIGLLMNHLTVPTLVIHGGKDAVVPVNNASVLMKSIQCKKRLVLIEDGDHNLSRDSDLIILRDNIIEWLKS